LESRLIALFESHRAGLLKPAQRGKNIIAGIIVGVVALPLAMAFAIASGAKPEQGLYTAIVAGFLTSASGGSRMQIAGPTGALIVILSGVTAKYGIAGLQIATLMAGLMLVAMGITRMGSVIKYIPELVIVGFTTGIQALSDLVEDCEHNATRLVIVEMCSNVMEKLARAGVTDAFGAANIFPALNDFLVTAPAQSAAT
jgi:MFS superfamily sulfate permease-like transporter